MSGTGAGGLLAGRRAVVTGAGRGIGRAVADWRWMLDVNVVAMVRVTAAFLPQLLDQPRSRVIDVSSIAGKKGTYGQAAYNASKHAQIGLTRCLALETGTTGLRVNAVCPGFTKTDLIDLEELGRAHGRPGADAWTTVEHAATIRRTVTLDEIAAAVVYLASPAADGVNGQSLVVDGGIVMS